MIGRKAKIMSVKSKILQLTFLNGAGKKTNVALPDAIENLTAVTVERAMNQIAQADSFSKDGVDLYKIPQSASYIERTVTSLFDHTRN
ncbi:MULTISPECIES: DUF2922 domain-containing protein [unclassified Lactobacillus]|uniref:DUF2922 domain-containing protein n=1 Tax=unclassified Lactobacillus TaxID=2620435 RepID=UPI001F372754|nr:MULTISPECIES: DUF2922 domain-containing protein [unclassified Lactobacillus]